MKWYKINTLKKNIKEKEKEEYLVRMTRKKKDKKNKR